MARIYEQYITGFDRDLMVMESEESIFNAKINFMLETVDRELELNKKEAELLVLRENGTYDDLQYLYQEAEEEANEKKEGIFATIVNAIRSIFASIGRAISGIGKKSQAAPDEEVEVNKEAWDAVDKVKAAWNSGIGKGALAAVATTMLAIKGLSIFANSKDKEGKEPGKLKVKARQLYSKIEFLKEEICKKIDGILPDFLKGNKEKKEGEADANETQIFGNRIKSLIAILTFGKFGKKEEEEEDTGEEEYKPGDFGNQKDQREVGYGKDIYNAKQKNQKAAAEEPKTSKGLNNNPTSPNNAGPRTSKGLAGGRNKFESAFDDEFMDDLSSTMFIESLFGNDDVDEYMEEDVDDTEILDMFDAIFE